MKQRVFGSLQPLPLREYRQILLDTGLDVDGRLEQLTHRQLPIYEHSYDLYRKCVCAIPGFLDLPNEDQDVLIKRGFVLQREAFDSVLQGLGFVQIICVETLPQMADEFFHDDLLATRTSVKAPSTLSPS